MYRRTRSSRRSVDLHRVHHLRGDEHGHRGPLFLIAPDVLEEVVAEELAEGLLELLEVLHGVGALPLRGLPLLGGHVAYPGRRVQSGSSYGRFRG